MGAIVSAIQFVINLIVSAVEWVAGLFLRVFISLWELVTDAFVWVFDQILGVAVSALGALDVSAFPAMSSFWSALPSAVLNILGVLGVNVAIGIIFAALAIRFALQLIPFVRLGS